MFCHKINFVNLLKGFAVIGGFGGIDPVRGGLGGIRRGKENLPYEEEGIQSEDKSEQQA